MATLKMSCEEIRQAISIKEDDWEYTQDTNCYAFALGLDIKENDIVKNAYQLGVIGFIINNISIDELKKMSLKERLLMDLKALKIHCEDSLESATSDLRVGQKYSDLWWIISLLTDGKRFHFMRKSYSGIWYQKWGYLAPVINYDFDRKVIANPSKANLGDYKVVKTYRLSYREKY